MRLAPRRLAALVATLTAVLLPLPGLTTSASASTPAISIHSFGMHYTNTADPYLVRFGASRIWDMGVTWRELQPSKGTTSATVLARLDHIVATQRAHGSQPLLTLGMTPAWAAHKC